MILPEHCKHVGVWDKPPEINDEIYFLTRYVVDMENKSIYEVELEGEGLIRRVSGVESIASDVVFHDEIVELFDRAKLIEEAIAIGEKAVVFRGREGHVNFVVDPDPTVIIGIEVFDVVPPYPPRLADVIHRLEETGVFGDLTVRFEVTTLDLMEYEGENVVFPCEASGLDGYFLDSPLPALDDPVLVGCDISRGIYEEAYGGDYRHVNTCPLRVYEPTGPFVVRCCMRERSGFHRLNDEIGVAVHWGASPYEVLTAVRELVGKIDEGSRG